MDCALLFASGRSYVFDLMNSTSEFQNWMGSQTVNPFVFESKDHGFLFAWIP